VRLTCVIQCAVTRIIEKPDCTAPGPAQLSRIPP